MRRQFAHRVKARVAVCTVTITIIIIIITTDIIIIFLLSLVLFMMILIMIREAKNVPHLQGGIREQLGGSLPVNCIHAEAAAIGNRKVV